MDKNVRIVNVVPDLNLFINPPSENLSEGSSECYRNDRKHYLDFCTTKNLSLGDVSSLEAYKAFLQSKSMKATTINRKLCGIKKGLVGYLVAIYGKDKEQIYRNLYKSVHQVKVSKGEKVVRPESILSDDDINKLIQGADKKTGLIIDFLAKTGCRISEVVHITNSDIQLKGTVVAIRILGKGNKERTVFISGNELNAIQNIFQGKHFLFETIHGNPYNRTNITKHLGKLSEQILGKHIYAHLLRHSFATNMIKKTRKIQAVSEYLGHSDVAITLQMYTHESLTFDELQIG